MKTSLKKLSISFLLLLAVCILMSTKATAQDLLPLQMDYDGDFTYGYYVDDNGTEDTADDFDVTVPFLLNFTDFITSSVFYLDGDVSGVDGVADDAMQDADVEWIFTGSFYNDDDDDGDPDNSGPNYIFGNTNNGGEGAGGVTGAIDFTIKNTATDEVFLTAQLSNFIADPCRAIPFPPYITCTPDPRVNFDYTLNSLWSLEVDPGYASSSSRYIQELGSVLNRNDGVVYNTDISMNFTMLTGSTDNDFIGNSNGTVQGVLVVMPEPVSSILFIAGGATLALRRYSRKKNNKTV